MDFNKLKDFALQTVVIVVTRTVRAAKMSSQRDFVRWNKTLGSYLTTKRLKHQ